MILTDSAPAFVSNPIAGKPYVTGQHLPSVSFGEPESTILGGITMIDATGGRGIKFTRTGKERVHVIETGGRRFSVALENVVKQEVDHMQDRIEYTFRVVET